MRLEEIQPSSAADQRVRQQKASAKAAKDRAKQMQMQADASDARLNMQKSRDKLGQIQHQRVTRTITPVS